MTTLKGENEIDLEAWVRDRVENLRPRLLDLTRRNPLLSTKLSPRSNSYVRSVDELPDVLAYNLGKQQSMRFDPLPPLEADPVDENTAEFRSAFSEAQRTNQVYLDNVAALRSGDPEAEEKVRQIDRVLKDTVREMLDLPARQTSGDISLADHAKIHGVSPEYDLPIPDGEHEDGRHRDDAIQTLLLPDQLDRRLNALVTKCNTWMQETGINVLHAAYGFLEWKDGSSKTPAMAPLVLMPVGLSKKKTPEGPEFWIKGLGEEGETNLVLAELLKQQFDIELPQFPGGSIENYLVEVAELAPSNLHWRVRRQVVFGVFPSARMAMYHDLDPAKNPHFRSPIVSQLLGGAVSGEAAPFADEYDVDTPEVEQKVPCLITEADSSQLSVLVDLAEKRSLAVEGPPGTGKSQTIVNAIAAAIAEGKKVLFVAEKMAALEVVKSRLEAVGLGEFVLPLQAERSTREQVVSSVRDRLAMETPHAPRHYDTKLSEFQRLRSNLNAYVETVSKAFGTSGLTVYEVLGKAIKANEKLRGAPAAFRDPPMAQADRITKADFSQILEAAHAFDRAHSDARKTPEHWSGIVLSRTDAIELDQIRTLAGKAADALGRAAACRDDLASWRVSETTSTEDIEAIKAALSDIKASFSDFSTCILSEIKDSTRAKALTQFVTECEHYQTAVSKLSKILKAPSADGLAEKIDEIISICGAHDFTSLKGELIAAELNERERAARALSEASKKLGPLQDDLSDLDKITIPALKTAHEIIRATGRATLALRNSTMEDPEAAARVQRAATQGARLSITKRELEEKIRIPSDIGASVLFQYADALSEAGFFAFFSGDYRAARKSLKVLSHGKPTRNKDGANLLKAAAQWKEDHQSFLDNAAVRQCFGLHFTGIDTDFAAFETLCEFYARIDEELSGAENRAIRSLLKKSDLETLLEIPDLGDADWNGALSALDRHIEAECEAIEAARRALDRVEPLCNIFSNLDAISVEALPRIIATVDETNARLRQLSGQTIMQDLLRAMFKGGDTDLNPLKEVLSVSKHLDPVSAYRSELIDALCDGYSNELIMALNAAALADNDAHESLNVLASRSGKSYTGLINRSDFRMAALYIGEAASDEDGLNAHARLYQATQRLNDLGYGWASKAFLEANITCPSLSELITAAIARAMSACVMHDHGAVLNKHPGRDLNEMRGRLATLDQEILKLSRQQLRALTSANANPPRGSDQGPKKSWSELSLIENEVAKQKRFVSVRDFTNRAGNALQELKPCWMMSPLAVAQYLPAETLRFDLCIIDEASQMRPEDALGALARCDQAMIVGDVNQLPPSNFFQKMVADDDDDDEDGLTVDEESILEIANAKLRPARRLRWHYRSQHSNLIRFSNELIYDRSLVIFPSSDEERPDRGVSLVQVEDGQYSNSVNPAEARKMVEAALHFMRATPNQSLGIVTLNQKQRDLIIDEMSYAMDRDETASQYVEDWKTRNDGLERFFIKNLENVQGDERDVIFIGTVYGPQQTGGPVMQRFGPLNGVAGRRRLNVLFSRAKKRIVTFTSMRPSDITATESSNPGTYMLKRWLEYSATNILEGPDEIYTDTDSDFEDFVIQQIKSMGCEAVPQVGSAGYRIDIGVRHPDYPGFILAVECDGASYHSCRSARDRDRLRQEVLERLGWNFHRIWSTDWFNDPRAETERLRLAIKHRLEDLKARQSRIAVATTPGQNNNVVEITKRPTLQPVERDLFDVSTDQTELAAEEPGRGQNHQARIDDAPPTYIEVGDTVRVRYVAQPDKLIQVTITENMQDPKQGLIAAHEPLAEALLGAENGEEVEVLIGSYVRIATIDDIRKPSA